MSIKTNLLELNKASEFCQVIFFKKSNRNIELFNLTASQHDLLNIIFYQANKFITKNKINLSNNDVTCIELSLKEITETIQKYNNNDYKQIINYLDDLSDVKVSINSLNKNKNIQEMTITRFILSITLSKHLITKNKVIRVMMDNKILSRIQNIKNYFSKMYLTIQLSMTSKYSKLLYELLKDYQGIKAMTFKVDILTDLLNVAEKSMCKWNKFNAHILKKAIKEINEKSDIKVTYEPIKEKLEGQRKQVTKIKFNIEEQNEDRLEELGLLNQEEELSIEDQILMNKAEQVYNNLPEFRKEKITDSTSYIKSIFKKDYNKLKNELRLDSWINDNITIDSDQPQTLSLLIGDNAYAITDNYLLKDLDSNENITKNATETIEFLNNIINNKEYNKYYTIEMLKLGIKQEFSRSSVNF